MNIQCQSDEPDAVGLTRKPRCLLLAIIVAVVVAVVSTAALSRQRDDHLQLSRDLEVARLQGQD